MADKKKQQEQEETRGGVPEPGTQGGDEANAGGVIPEGGGEAEGNSEGNGEGEGGKGR